MQCIVQERMYRDQEWIARNAQKMIPTVCIPALSKDAFLKVRIMIRYCLTSFSIGARHVPPGNYHHRVLLDRRRKVCSAVHRGWDRRDGCSRHPVCYGLGRGALAGRPSGRVHSKCVMGEQRATPNVLRIRQSRCRYVKVDDRFQCNKSRSGCLSSF